MDLLACYQTPLGASLLQNLFAGKGVIPDGKAGQGF